MAEMIGQHLILGSTNSPTGSHHTPPFLATGKLIIRGGAFLFAACPLAGGACWQLVVTLRWAECQNGCTTAVRGSQAHSP